MLQFEVFGKPLPLNRPRACKKGSFISIYDSQIKEKEQVRWQIRSLYRDNPLKIPISINLLFAMPIPKGVSRVRTRLMLQGDLIPMKKPDIDNLIKFIFDCLNGILFDDDSQIIEVSARKIYSDVPRTIIRALPLNFNLNQESNKGESDN